MSIAEYPSWHAFCASAEATIEADINDRIYWEPRIGYTDNRGRIAIPRGSKAEQMVGMAPDNDLILDLESVEANGQRYAVRNDPSRVESQRETSLVGAIIERSAAGKCADGPAV